MPDTNPQILSPEQAQQVASKASKGPAKVSGQQVEQADIQKFLKNTTTGQLENPGNALIWQLGNALSSLKPAETDALLKQIPAGSTLAEGLNLALHPPTSPTPGSTTAQSDALANILGGAYTDSILPALQTIMQSTGQGVSSDVSAMQNALKGASPQMQAAMQGIPQAIQASEDNASRVTMEGAATQPEYTALLNAINQLTTGYKAAQQAYGILPYYQAATQGITPTIPGVTLQGGGIAPPSLIPPPA